MEETGMLGRSKCSSPTCKRILYIKPSITGGKDKRIWLKKSTGSYTTKTGYYTAMEAKQRQEVVPIPINRNWLRDVWKLAIPPKDQNVPMELKHDALPVNERLHARQIIPSVKCTFLWSGWIHSPSLLPLPLCSSNLELSTHILKPFVNRLYIYWYGPPTLTLGDSAPTHLAAWIIWNIWISRNHKIFQNRSFSPQETILKVITSAREWQEAQVVESCTKLPRSTLMR